jgi:cystathionine beta-lyase
VKWGAVESDVIPAWVADMDFGVPPMVRTRMREVLDRGDLGYPFWPDGDPLVRAFEERMGDRFAWSPCPGRTRVFTDLIQILQVVIESATSPGDGVALHVPNYPPFLASIERSGRRIVPLPMRRSADGWDIEIAGLGNQLREAGVRLMLIVNPHNPTGRVLTRAELAGLADGARDAGAVVLSDEIHADLVFDGATHVPFASLSADAAARTITATSATKAFNIAGMRCAVAHVGSDAVWERVEAAPLDYFGQPSILSRVATVAAWTESHEWLDGVRAILAENRATVAEWVDRSPFDIGHRRPEASYLSWFDFGGTAIAGDPAAEIERRGRVRLSAGADFSQHTDIATSAFARLNGATSPEILRVILDRIGTSLAEAHRERAGCLM